MSPEFNRNQNKKKAPSGCRNRGFWCRVQQDDLEFVVEADAYAVICSVAIVLVVFIGDIEGNFVSHRIIDTGLPFGGEAIGNNRSIAIQLRSQISVDAHSVKHFAAGIIVIAVADNEADIRVKLVLGVNIGSVPISAKRAVIIVALDSQRKFVGDGVLQIITVIIGAVTQTIVAVTDGSIPCG